MDLEDNQLMNKGSLFLSYSNFYANPFYLRTISKLVGIDAAPLESAKILELGCAAGGNIIPFAVRFPNSQIVGIDSSEEYIQKGIELKNQLNLTNIDLIATDILEVDLSIGKFDYINIKKYVLFFYLDPFCEYLISYFFSASSKIWSSSQHKLVCNHTQS